MTVYAQTSSWNDYPTDDQFRDLRRVWHILNYDYTEADVPTTRWQARNLQHELWGKVRLRRREAIEANSRAV